MSKQTKARQKKASWHYIPRTPITVNPLFSLPMKLQCIVMWYAKQWLRPSAHTVYAGLAFFSWYFFHPSLEYYTVFSWKILALDHIRNLSYMIAVAGGLHLYFFTYKKQGNFMQYDARSIDSVNAKYTFGRKIWDNIFWTLVSGVSVWTIYQTIFFTLMARDVIPSITWATHPIWFIAMFFIIPLWESSYFYWTHRFMHIPFIYKYVHALHHKNINLGPWSGYSMSSFEHILALGTLTLHLFLPSHPIHVIFHLYWVTLLSASSHTGFNGFVRKEKMFLTLGTFHHQMHHRYFNCNFGNLEVPWDKWMGTFNDGHDEQAKKEG